MGGAGRSARDRWFAALLVGALATAGLAVAPGAPTAAAAGLPRAALAARPRPAPHPRCRRRPERGGGPPRPRAVPDDLPPARQRRRTPRTASPLDDHTIGAERIKAKATKDLAFEYAIDRTDRRRRPAPFPTAAERQAVGDRRATLLLNMYTRSRLAVPPPLGGTDRDINTSEELLQYATAYDTLLGAGYAFGADDAHDPHQHHRSRRRSSTTTTSTRPRRRRHDRAAEQPPLEVGRRARRRRARAARRRHRRRARRRTTCARPPRGSPSRSTRSTSCSGGRSSRPTAGTARARTTSGTRRRTSSRSPGRGTTRAAARPGTSAAGSIPDLWRAPGTARPSAGCST